SYSNGEIKIEDVLTVTGGVSQQILTDIAQAMFQQDTKETLHLFDKLIQNGKDPGRFVFDFIYFLRDMLFYKTAPELEAYLERAIVTESFTKLTEMVDTEWIQKAIVQFTECEQQIKWTTSPKVFVEITILTITNLYYEAGEVVQEQQSNTAQVIELTNRINQLEKKLQGIENSSTTSQPTPAR